MLLLSYGSGTGTFSDATLLHPIYTPSQNDIDDGPSTSLLQQHLMLPVLMMWMK